MGEGTAIANEPSKLMNPRNGVNDELGQHPTLGTQVRWAERKPGSRCSTTSFLVADSPTPSLRWPPRDGSSTWKARIVERRGPSSKIKFTCSGCGQNCWGKPDLMVRCDPCGVLMTSVT